MFDRANERERERERESDRIIPQSIQYPASDINKYQDISFGGKLGPARRADSCAIPDVPNVKSKLEDQNCITALDLHEVLRESFTF